jgi:hypothetical protein
MSLGSGRRKVGLEGRAYEWVLRRRPDSLHVVIQDAQSRGQLLVAEFPVFGLVGPLDSDGCYWVRTQVSPATVCRLIAEAADRGWRPADKGLPPFPFDAGPLAIQEELAASYHGTDLSGQDVADLWGVLRSVYRDPVWRQRLLTCPWGEAFPVPDDFVGEGDPARVARVAALGGVVAYRRQEKPKDGDTDPCFAVRATGTWLEVLMNVSHLYRG